MTRDEIIQRLIVSVQNNKIKTVTSEIAQVF